MFDVLGGRKFLLVMIFSLFVTGLTYMGKLEVNVLLDFLKWMAGFYVAGNVAEGVRDAVVGKKD